MRRSLFNDDHQAFREMVRSFYEETIVPEYAEWERAGAPPRDFWTAAGKLGLLGIQVPEEFGGGGESSFLYNVILTEETQHVGIALGGLRMQTDIAMPYFLRVANREQQQRWLPRLVSGEALSALAMSEHGTRIGHEGGGHQGRPQGRHLRSQRLEDVHIQWGQRRSHRHRGEDRPGRRPKWSQPLVIEADSPGFSRGRKLEKLGLKAQDLAELNFDDVEVPAENLLGREGQGFGC